jgi:hypothetical protein
MLSSLLGGTTSIEALFSPNLESFSLFSSSTDASGNPTPVTDASGNGMFGNTFSLFSSSSTDASGNPTTPTAPTAPTAPDADASTNDSTNGSTSSTSDGSNTNPSIAPYVDFFTSLFFLFIQICIIIYLGSSFLTLVYMSNSKRFLNAFIPSDINSYPYCTPSDPSLGGQGASHVEVDGDALFSFGFPYNFYCEPGDDEGNTCSKTCNEIKKEVKSSSLFGYKPFSFWLSMSSKNTYAALRAIFKTIFIKLNSVVIQDQSDSYNIVENIVMFIGIIFMFIFGLFSGFIGFFLTYVFQMYNSGFILFGLAWTFGLCFLSWIPPLLNFFGFILQSIIMFLWIPFVQINANTQSKLVFEIFKRKKSLIILLFSLGMIMNAFTYLSDNEPYYVVFAVALFLFNMYVYV